MTSHTFDTTTLPYSQVPGYTPVVHAHFTIAVNLGSRADVTVNSALATPAPADEGPPPPQIAAGTGAHDAALIDDLVSDADEFTSVPSAAPALPAIPDAATPGVAANGAGNGHTTLVG